METARARPGLTIRVYRINPATRQVTTLIERTELPPAEEVDATWAWPPCACIRCTLQAT